MATLHTFHHIYDYWAEADAICQKWDPEVMAQRDAEVEEELWNNRLFTAPRLLDDR